jgi:hypothetical protein
MYYGEYALELMRTHGRVIALWVAGLIVAGAVVWWLRARRRTHTEAPGTP